MPHHVPNHQPCACYTANTWQSYSQYPPFIPAPACHCQARLIKAGGKLHKTASSCVEKVSSAELRIKLAAAAAAQGPKGIKWCKAS
jgi:hypothetical protein